MADWSPLRALLDDVEVSVSLPWDELDHLVGGLPRSAYVHNAFWKGERSGWPGFTTTSVRVGVSVTFVRRDGKPTAGVPEEVRTLLERPSAAVLTTYRKDGAAASSPVWFRVADGHLEVVIADDDVKLKHLATRPACSLLIFETVPPFRGLRVEGEPELSRDGVHEARLAIARRFLGTNEGEQFADARGSGVVVRMPLSRARYWDLSTILP